MSDLNVINFKSFNIYNLPCLVNTDPKLGIYTRDNTSSVIGTFLDLVKNSPCITFLNSFLFLLRNSRVDPPFLFVLGFLDILWSPKVDLNS